MPSLSVLLKLVLYSQSHRVCDVYIVCWKSVETAFCNLFSEFCILCVCRPDSEGSFPLPSIPLLGLKEPLSNLPEIEHIPRKPRHFNTKLTICGGSYQAKVKACRLPGQRPRRTPLLKLPYTLGEYPVPYELREAVEDGDGRDVMMMKPCLEEVGAKLLFQKYCVV